MPDNENNSKNMVLTLNGEAILNRLDPKPEQKDPFVLELGKPASADLFDPACNISPLLYQELVLACTIQKESDFLYQLRLAKAKDESSQEKELCWYDFVFVSFDKYLNSSKGEADKKKRENRVRILFRNGFRLAGTSSPVLVPFIMSASMARRSQISFLREDLVSPMNSRLDMGLFSYDGNSEYCLSKYYAYRALSMSGGTRINPDPRLLNENTVFILKPPHVRKHPEDDKKPKVYTCQEVKSSTTSKQDHLDGVREFSFMLKCDKRKPDDIKSFDGEGMISFKAADALGAALGYSGSSSLPSSFQIRMPFAKGMLHKLDFKRFCIEEFGISEDDYDTAEVEDYFGIKRCVAKISIVMTDSMFKAAKALMKWKEEHNNEDPMAAYFSAFHSCGRAMYVLRTDKSMKGNGTVFLNYQFLGTAKLKRNDLQDMIRDSLASYCLPLWLQNSVYDEVKIRWLTEGGIQDSEEISEADISEENHLSRFARAVKKCPELLHDPKIRERLKDEATGMVRKAAAKGQIPVPGCNLFLSDDLIFLMSAFAKQVKDSSQSPQKETKKGNNTLPEPFRVFWNHKSLHRFGSFYAPQVIDRFLSEPEQGSRFFAVLRSPHLSRNEQCALSAYIPKGGSSENLYQKYCGHLSGVIMLPYKNLIASRLGGADYDGDIVKVIAEDRFTKSAWACSSEPSVMIPSYDPKSAVIPSRIQYDTIRDSFGGRVGRFSNDAVRVGALQYSDKIEDAYKKFSETGMDTPEEMPDFAAGFSILVGLEVDRAKTGIRPDERLDQLGLAVVRDYRRRENGGRTAPLGPYLLDNKENLASLDLKSIKTDGASLEAKLSYPASGKAITMDAPAEGSALLDCLPYDVLSIWDDLTSSEKKVRNKSLKFHAAKKDPSDTHFQKFSAVLLAAKEAKIRSNLMRCTSEKRLRGDAFLLDAVYLLQAPDVSAEKICLEAREVIADAIQDKTRRTAFLSFLINGNWSMSAPEERMNLLAKYLIPQGLPEEEKKQRREKLIPLTSFSEWKFRLLPDLTASALIQDANIMQEILPGVLQGNRTLIKNLYDSNADDSEAALLDTLLAGLNPASGCTVSDCRIALKQVSERSSHDDAAVPEDVLRILLHSLMPRKKGNESTSFSITYGCIKRLSQNEALWDFLTEFESYSALFQSRMDKLLQHHIQEDGEVGGSFPEHELWKLCRKELLKAADGQSRTAIGLWAALAPSADKDHDILWKVFTPDEICSALEVSDNAE